MHNKMLHMVTFGLLIIGGLNWLLDAFGFNLVEMIFKEDSMITKAIYVLVGISTIVVAITHKHSCRMCSSVSAPQQAAPTGSDMV